MLLRAEQSRAEQSRAATLGVRPHEEEMIFF